MARDRAACARNALIPVITTIGLQVGVLMAGAILTETIFSWPGIGKWMVDSVFRRDYPVIQGGLLIIAGDHHDGQSRRRPALRPGQPAHPAPLRRRMADIDASSTRARPIGAAAPRRAMLAEFWHYFAENRGALIGLVFFVAARSDRDLRAARSRRTARRARSPTPAACRPSGRRADASEFLLGTDAIGRDILSRLIFGARFSLFIGVVVVAVSLTSGIVIGLIAGYFRGWVDIVIMRLMDIILAFPSLLLALVLVAVLGPGLINAMIAIALRLSAAFRAADARLGDVGASQGLRRRRARRRRRAAPADVQAPSCRTAWRRSSCRRRSPSPPPSSTPPRSASSAWARSRRRRNGAPMLAEAREFILRAWWVVTFPGLAILVTVLAINLVGDGLRDALDPKLKRS